MPRQTCVTKTKNGHSATHVLCLNVRHGWHGLVLFLSHKFVGVVTSGGLLGSHICDIKGILYDRSKAEKENVEAKALYRRSVIVL